MPAEDGSPSPLEPGIRAGGCAGCTLCCKVLAVPTLEKPANIWCQHCIASAGCGIYQTRPTECATFICGYLSLTALGEEWKPLTSRLIIDTQSVEGAILVYVDPARPDAWRRQPYYRTLQAWAAQGLPTKMWVVVRIRRRNIVILPDGAVDVGTIEPDELIAVVTRRNGPVGGSAYQVYVAKKDAWGALGNDVTLGRHVPRPGDGFRTGQPLG